ncbi:MAG TPA: hypothetical protein VGL55_03760 [Steroidobacteraceae bacterium]|jgi:homoserine dehydrogenase
MSLYRLAFLGDGVVARALHSMLADRREALAREYGIDFVVVGIASRSLGWRAQTHGMPEDARLAPDRGDMDAWLADAHADVMFEAIALDPHQGQPALSYIERALERGVHVVSANKGPVVHGYRALRQIARRRRKSYRFESAVMDGAPVFSLARECLPQAHLRGVRGVFTSTATIVLEAMEAGLSLSEGVLRAQQLGIAEADPSYDVDGWDSVVKLCALANVVLHGDLRPADVARTGLRALEVTEIRSAQAAGTPYRLVGEVSRGQAGRLSAQVRPLRCSPSDPLFGVTGTTLVTHFEADVFPGGLTITSRDPDPATTAYGMLADFIGIVRGAEGAQSGSS